MQRTYIMLGLCEVHKVPKKYCGQRTSSTMAHTTIVYITLLFELLIIEEKNSEIKKKTVGNFVIFHIDRRAIVCNYSYEVHLPYSFWYLGTYKSRCVWSSKESTNVFP